MSGGRTLLVRADASATMGVGHVLRCLALAQAWQDGGGAVALLSHDLPPALRDRVEGEGVEVVAAVGVPGSAADAARLAALAGERQAAWVVVDGYHFGTDYQVALVEAGQRLLCLDDNGHAGRYAAHLVLNQNAHAAAETYRDRAARTRLLLGCDYALIRRDLRLAAAPPRPPEPARARAVLVTLGGSDPDDATRRVLEALSTLPAAGLEVTVLVGPANPRRAALEALGAASPVPTRLVHDARDMATLYARADLAVSAAGSTTWELALFGVPAALLVIADNQVASADAVAALGVAALVPGRPPAPDVLAGAVAALVGDAGRRQALSDAGRRLVDGCGGARVVAAMQDAEEAS